MNDSTTLEPVSLDGFEYESAMEEVKQITSAFKRNDLPVDQMFDKAQRATHLLAQANQMLHNTEANINKVLAPAN